MTKLDDPSLAAIEARTLMKRAKSVVPRVRERAIEALHEHVQLSATNDDQSCYQIYLKALEEVDSAQSR